MQLLVADRYQRLLFLMWIAFWGNGSKIYPPAADAIDLRFRLQYKKGAAGGVPQRLSVFVALRWGP